MSAPDRIWVVGSSASNWGASMEWRGAPNTVGHNSWDTEYVRADIATAEAEKWKKAFSAQSSKLQSVLHIEGVRDLLGNIKDNP